MTGISNDELCETISDIYLDDLNEVIKDKLPDLLNKPEYWKTLVINRRKPFTYRAYTYIGRLRVCLHRFEVCEEEEAFLHPHPWDGAFKLLEGSYLMKVGISKDRKSHPDFATKIKLTAGCQYAMTNPLTFHAITPLSECYTVMLNGTPYSSAIAHEDVKTTKGKDLQEMTPEELLKHLKKYKELLGCV